MRISDWSSDVCSSDLDFHVITGGPGSGKSTLIEALAVEGFDHMPKAGRAIIRDQVAIGRSEERRVGKEGVSTCRSRWSTTQYKKNTNDSIPSAIFNE